MNDQHAKGAADKVKGAVKDAVGGLTGDSKRSGGTDAQPGQHWKGQNRRARVRAGAHCLAAIKDS